MAIFFTSDPHFFHKGILQHCSRPFSTVREMNQTLINNWNSVVKHDDEVWILGDLFFISNKDAICSVLEKLNGKLNWIIGNHDSEKILSHEKITSFFSFIGYYKEISVKTSSGNYKKICLMHYPIAEWNKKDYGSWHLHGHMHGERMTEDLSYDVGVDTNPMYRPYSLKEIEEIMTTKKNYAYVSTLSS